MGSKHRHMPHTFHPTSRLILTTGAGGTVGSWLVPRGPFRQLPCFEPLREGGKSLGMGQAS